MINLLIKTGTACWKPRINEFLHVPQNDNLETENDQKSQPQNITIIDPIYITNSKIFIYLIFFASVTTA